jgi:hypothetical protein
MQNEFSKLTEDVENECPVGKYFGVTGVGEGSVWVGKFISPRDGQEYHLRFKVKGDKHSASKVKTLAAVDVEKLAGILDFIKYSVTDNRMNQGFDELFTNTDIEPAQKHIGPFIKWVRDDVIKEESDTMAENNILAKDIGKSLSVAARTWFMTKINQISS